MDISRKLYKDDIILLNEMQTELLRKNTRVTQKDLIDKAIKFASEHDGKFLSYISKNKKGDNRREMTDKILSLPKASLGKNWHEEIDTLEHEDMLRRSKKR